MSSCAFALLIYHFTGAGRPAFSEATRDLLVNMTHSVRTVTAPRSYIRPRVIVLVSDDGRDSMCRSLSRIASPGFG